MARKEISYEDTVEKTEVYYTCDKCGLEMEGDFKKLEVNPSIIFKGTQQTLNEKYHVSKQGWAYAFKSFENFLEMAREHVGFRSDREIHLCDNCYKEILTW